MKTIKHHSKLLLATLYLLLSPAMVLAGQANWNDIPGGKVVDGNYQIKCGEGTGWQKCGEEEKKENTYASVYVIDHFMVHVPKNFDAYWSIYTVDEDLNITYKMQNVKTTQYLPPGFKKRKYSTKSKGKTSYFYAADFSYYIKPIVVDGEEWFVDPELPSNKNLVPDHPEGMFSMQFFTATKK